MKLFIFILFLCTVVLQLVTAGPILQENDPNIQNPEQQGKVTYLEYYGGARGQILQITETVDGKVVTEIIKSPPPTAEVNKYQEKLKLLEDSARNVLRLEREQPKLQGRVDVENEEDDEEEQIKLLSESARDLARMQEDVDEEDDGFLENDEDMLEDRSGLSAWFERKKQTSVTNKNDKKKKEKEREKEKEKEEEEEEEESSSSGGNKNGSDDAVEVNLPPDDASIAEAKPVGLAIAGVGGVASSKPVATAVVGPGGLAVARPVATAIAGVPPEQALGGEGLASKPPKKKIVSSSSTAESSDSDLLNKFINKYHNQP